SRSSFVSSRRRHTCFSRDWSSEVCSSDLRREVRLSLPPVTELRVPCAPDAAGPPPPCHEVPDPPSSQIPRPHTRRHPPFGNSPRSEERRVGTERTARWSQGGARQ